jgi:hypothetical protein
MSPNWVFSCFIRRSVKMAPSSRIAARTVLMTAATQATWFSLICSVSSVTLVVFEYSSLEECVVFHNQKVCA